MKRPLVINIIVGVAGVLVGALLMLFLRPASTGGGASANQARYVENVRVGKFPPQGSPDAKVTIVEFGDFQCPYCKEWHDTIAPALKEKYGDQIVLYFRHFPLASIHPQAKDGAVAAECANDQGKFWEMHDAMYAADGVLDLRSVQGMAESVGLDIAKFNSCVATNPFQDNISADTVDGVSYGAYGTPTFFINGNRLVGLQPLERYVAIIDQELSK